MGTKGNAHPPNAGPKARALAKKLREHILAHCQAHDQLPTEEELAARNRCSTTTVRAALGLLVAEGLVFRRQGSGTYVTEQASIGSAATAFFYYGSPQQLLLTPWARDVYLGALSAAQKVGRDVPLTVLGEQRPIAVRRDRIGAIDRSRIDSVICLEVFNHTLLAELAQEVPAVSIDFPCFQPGVSSAYLDHDQNLDILVEHLWRLGHRRIALAGNIGTRRVDPAAASRCVAFRKALTARGLPFSSQSILSFGAAPMAIQHVRTLAKTRSGERPTAVICVNFHWVFAQAAVLLGVNIPGELSLVALGDEGPWAEYLTARSRHLSSERHDVQQILTGAPTDLMDPSFAALRNMRVCAARLPFERMGEWALAEALRRVEHAEAPSDHKSFTCTIEPGNSVAPPSA